MVKTNSKAAASKKVTKVQNKRTERKQKFDSKTVTKAKLNEAQQSRHMFVAECPTDK